MIAQPSFEQVVVDHQQMVFRTLARLIGRSDDLDDLAQEVFLRLFRALPGFRGEALLGTYIYRITINVAQNEWKRRQRTDRRNVSLSEPRTGPDGGSFTWEDRLEHPDANALECLEQREFQALVEEHLNQLSAIEKTVLVLYHQEERSYVQIAEILHLPVGTVRTHLHRGRKRLKAALGRKEVTP